MCRVAVVLPYVAGGSAPTKSLCPYPCAFTFIYRAKPEYGYPFFSLATCASQPNVPAPNVSLPIIVQSLASFRSREEKSRPTGTPEGWTGRSPGPGTSREEREEWGTGRKPQEIRWLLLTNFLSLPFHLSPPPPFFGCRQSVNSHHLKKNNICISQSLHSTAPLGHECINKCRMHLA